MNAALKNMIYNCRQATFLIEKKLSGKITIAEAIQLQVHLAGCTVCKTFQQQSLIINRLFVGFKTEELKLDKDFKLMLKMRIEKEINKN